MCKWSTGLLISHNIHLHTLTCMTIVMMFLVSEVKWLYINYNNMVQIYPWCAIAQYHAIFRSGIAFGETWQIARSFGASWTYLRKIEMQLHRLYIPGWRLWPLGNCCFNIPQAGTAVLLQIWSMHQKVPDFCLTLYLKLWQSDISVP